MGPLNWEKYEQTSTSCLFSLRQNCFGKSSTPCWPSRSSFLLAYHSANHSRVCFLPVTWLPLSANRRLASVIPVGFWHLCANLRYIFFAIPQLINAIIVRCCLYNTLSCIVFFYILQYTLYLFYVMYCVVYDDLPDLYFHHYNVFFITIKTV